MNWAEFCAENIPEPAAITVEPYEGSGAYGDVFGDPVEVTLCVVEDTRRVVRVQTGTAAGKEQLSSTTVFAPLDTVAPAGSRVTVPGGRVAQVLAVSQVTAHGHDLPEHLELNLE